MSRAAIKRAEERAWQRDVTRARAFCPTCDGTGLVGEDDPLRYPTPCPECGGCGRVPVDAGPIEPWNRHDDGDRIIAACVVSVMLVAALGLAAWALIVSGALPWVW